MYKKVSNSLQLANWVVRRQNSDKLRGEQTVWCWQIQPDVSTRGKPKHAIVHHPEQLSSIFYYFDLSH
jgi:hypothetical protein